MAKPKDYYELLGVDRKASADEIRSAYRKLAQELHPDVNKATDAAKKFAEVQEAYDVLSDVEKRTSYDTFGHAGPGMSGSRGHGGSARPGTGPFEGVYYGGGPGGGWSQDSSGMGEEDMQSIFEQMFGGRAGGSTGFGRGGSPFGATGGGGGARTRARPQPQRGADIDHTIAITFMTAVLGGSEQLRMATPSESGESQTITVKIPPGIESGAKLRIKGRGMAGSKSGLEGDVILNVQVGEHPYFRREGLDLLMDIPITIVEAVKGVSVRLPLLNGTAQVKIPPGTASGKRLRIKGKGITDAKGVSGDFFAVIQITAPPETDLSAKAVKGLNEVSAELQNPRESAPWADEVRERSA